LTVGDFVDLDDSSKGFEQELRMCCAVLEVYDRKDILIPNKKIITSLFLSHNQKCWVLLTQEIDQHWPVSLN
jgi:small-conductance mechanosensitive channel